MLIILLIAVLCLNHPALSIEIRLDNFEDIKAVSGAKVTMTCQVDDIRDPLEECDWYSPDGKKYSGKTSGGSNDRSDRDDRVRLDRDNKDLDDSVKVTIDDRRDECTIEFNSLRPEHAGAWECVAYDGRDEASKYAFVRVTAKNDKFQLLLDPDEKQLDVTRGDDVKILCPSNQQSNTPLERPVCFIYSPAGKKYNIIGKYGETYDYSADGIEVAGNLDNGECGIIIRNVGFANSGTWKCELLRKQRPGSAVIGSEVTNAEIKLDVFRTSRLADDEGPVLQGLYEGDRNGEIIIEVEIDETKYEYTDFYWIVQRTLKVYEGELECLGSGNRKNCYEAQRRRRIGRRSSQNGGIVKYELILDVDEITTEDVDNKLVLVKDYREFNSKVDKFEVFIVPKKRQSRDLDKDVQDDEFSQGLVQNQRFTRQRVTAGQGCLIKDEFIETDSSMEYPELCIELVCHANGNVDARSMRESKCRRRKPKRN